MNPRFRKTIVLLGENLRQISIAKQKMMAVTKLAHLFPLITMKNAPQKLPPMYPLRHLNYGGGGVNNAYEKVIERCCNHETKRTCGNDDTTTAADIFCHTSLVALNLDSRNFSTSHPASCCVAKL